MNAPFRSPLRVPCRLLLTTAALLSSFAAAADYRSVREAAILYDTPSAQGRPLFIAAPGTPVEVIVVTDQWIKVRDAGGAITWIASAALSDKRTVLVTGAQAAVRERPDAAAPLVFEAGQQLVLEAAGEPANGWLRVRHQDGSSGYIRVIEVWGL